MSLASDGDRPGRLVLEPAALAGLLFAGIGAVVALPELAPHLPRAGRPEQATYAATSLGVIALSGAYLFAVARRTRAANPHWLLWTGLYNAALVVVKFILSPAAFEGSTTSLTSFVVSGLIVMPLYIVGLVLVYHIAVRRTGARTWPSRISLAVGLAGAAVVTRLLAAAALESASQYLRDLAGGRGLILPAVVAAASLAVAEAFRRAGSASRDAVSTGIALVLVDHVLWVVYMNRLFS